MALDIEKARSAGYSDAEIVDYLGKSSTLDINKARAAGYDDTALIKHLSAPKQEVPKPAVPAAPPAATGPKGKDTTQLPDDDETGDFMRGIYNYLPQLQETYGGAKVFTGMGLKKLGATETGQGLIESGKESMDIGESKQLTRESDSLTKAFEKGIGTVVTDWLPYNIGSGVASIAETLAVMGVGAGVGALTGAGVGAVPGAISGAISKTLVKKGIKEAAENIIEAEAKKAAAAGATKQAAKAAGEAAGATFIAAQSKNVLLEASEMAAKAYGKAGAKSYGATAAMAGQAGLYGTGETTSRAVNEAERAGMDIEDIDYGRLATAAAIHSVADFFVNKIGVDALKIGDKATQSLILDIGKRIAVTGLKQIPAEEIQTIAERYGANLSLTDAEALREYVDTAGAAFAMSAAPGAVGGAKTHYVNKVKESAAKAEASGETYKDSLTVNRDVVPPSTKGFTQEDADLLMPATDAAGKPIVADVTTPEVTEATPAPKKPRTSGVALDTIEDAANYVQALDAGSQKPNTMQLNKLMLNLGITPPEEKGAGYLGRAVAAVKARLAEQGASNVAGTDIEAGGGSPDVAALAPATQTTAGSIGSQPRGMVSTGTDAGSNLAGAGKQPAALNAGTQRLITDELQGGATPAELITKYGSTPALVTSVDTFIKSLSPQGTPSGPATSQTQQTKAQEQAAAAGTAITPKKIEDLSPELQAEVTRRQTLIAGLEAAGRDATEEKGYLNKFLAKQGVTGTLPARRETKSIKKDFLEEGKLPYAVEGEETTGVAQDQERVQAYKESLTNEEGKPRTIPDYDISGEDQQLYNEMRDEINPQVKAANKTRLELIAAFDAARAAYEQAEAGQEEEAAFKAVNAAEDAVEKHGPAQRELPEYSKKFAADYKDVYFGNISAGPLVNGKRTFGSSRREHRKAAAALQAYLQKTGGSNKEELTAEQRRAINQYEEGRSDYSKIFDVEFPSWPKLTQEQKNIFLPKNVPTLAGAQQTIAFAKLATQLNKDNSRLTEGEKREKQNIIDRQEEVRRKSEEQQERDRKAREDMDRNKASASTLPANVIKMVMDGNLRGVLEYMGDVRLGINATPTKRVMKIVAQALSSLNLTTKIKIVESKDIDGDLAQYDPANDTIYVSREGLSSTTILHEIVHAGTVKVINEYLYGNKKSLSQLQLNAIRQLERIMEETRGTLSVDHPDAYKNLFEFVSYALTSDQLQKDLREESAASVGARQITRRIFGDTSESIGTNLPEKKSQWSKFKLAVAGLLKIRDVYLTKSGNLNKTVEPDFVMEIAAAFEDIIAKPTEPIYLPALPAATPKGKGTPAAAPATAPKPQTSGLYEADKNYKASNKEKYGLDVEGDLSKLGRVKRAFSRYGWRDFVTKAQSRRQHIRAYENELAMAGLLKRDPTGVFNNVSEKQDLALNQGVRYAVDYLQQPLQKLHSVFGDWLTESGQSTEKGFDQFHRLAEMFGAGEKRFAKWITSSPLEKTQNIMHNGKPISAAERRIQLMGDPRTGKDGLIHRVALDAQQTAAIRKELTYLATNHADSFGDSPRITEKMQKRFDAPGSKYKGIGTKLEDPIYNALGIEQDTIDKRMAEFNAKSDKEKELIKELFAQIKLITDATTELNKIGNYWSMPVSNIVGIYNYQYYMPFKGLSKHSKTDEMVDPNSKMNGAELQDEIHAAEGRFSTSDNPLLQTIYDGYKAASRAGRKDFTQAVENAVEPTTSKDAYNPTGTGVLPGRVVKTVRFWERDTTDLSKYKGANSKYMFNYKSDGSFNIIAIDNPKLLQAIRYPFQEKTPLWDAANRITGFFGSMHTRFNYNFAPKDFVVNTLTNAWIGATSEKIGVLGAAAYIRDVGLSVARNGLSKAMNIAVLHEVGSVGSKKVMEDMAAKDPFVRDMLEMIRYGGKSTFMESFSLKSNLETLSENSFGKNNIITDPISATKLLDSWNNMFEFTSRTAMYSLYKERALKQNIADGMSNKKGPNGEMSPAERAAAEESAAFTLNLANFSQQGEWGKIMGGLYMFSKPSATGAVRALEAVLPAFTSVERAMKDLPPVIENNQAAKDKYRETFKKRQFNARVMTTTLFGSGMGLFALSMMGSPDDEWERNAALTDNMEQWTRYARFHIPNEVSERIGLGKDIVFQIPWGFGPGAFAASGAQFAAMIAGTINPLEMASNVTFTIMTDAFLPLPMSKIPFTDNPVMWALDSVSPTVIRPLVEWVANINGIGQAINSASQRRMGDAYTGGDRIPEIYKDVADELYESTKGAIDISPNTMYFFTNSYLDGVAKIGELGYSWVNLGKGEKEFNAKTDLPLFGSFFGAKTNVDSREYGKVEKKILEIDKRLNTLDKRNPVLYAEFVAGNPLYPSIVEQYRASQGELNELRKRAFEIRNDKYLAIKDRDALVKLVILEQNMLKHRLVEDFKAMGLER
jgi:hypothetical protein